jgi:predicted 3-demethylubiquinone-9 3-methyltransferase (glyoxalase superfamily)
MPTVKKINPCLWFDHQAEEAARFYTATFESSEIVAISRYTEVGKEIHGRPPGSVMTVDFLLAGHPFTALNGGPAFKFNEAISLQVHCDTQKEIDHYWSKLSAGGDETAQQCGWLKDRYGVSWQIVPTSLAKMMGDSDKEKASRVMAALLPMKKLDLEALRRAYDGKA